GEYAATIEGRGIEEMRAAGARVPRLDLERERAVQATALRAAEAGLLQSAHDCSDGGLAVALAESCFSSLNRASIGVNLALKSDALPVVEHLFGETPSRIVISFDESAGERIREIASEANCPLTPLGVVGGTRLRISVGDDECISTETVELETAWRSSLGAKLQREVLAAAAE
ncbi:MAG: AIR synthase-related protein, partial [Pyrinomonadaceae bacterium]